jgi:hypothetical protein
MPETNVIITPTYKKLESNKEIEPINENSSLDKNETITNPKTGDKLLMIFPLFITIVSICIYLFIRKKSIEI